MTFRMIFFQICHQNNIHNLNGGFQKNIQFIELHDMNN